MVVASTVFVLMVSKPLFRFIFRVNTEDKALVVLVITDSASNYIALVGAIQVHYPLLRVYPTDILKWEAGGGSLPIYKVYVTGTYYKC